MREASAIVMLFCACGPVPDLDPDQDTQGTAEPNHINAALSFENLTALSINMTVTIGDQIPLTSFMQSRTSGEWPDIIRLPFGADATLSLKATASYEDASFLATNTTRTGDTLAVTCTPGPGACEFFAEWQDPR